MHKKKINALQQLFFRFKKVDKIKLRQIMAWNVVECIYEPKR